MAMKAGSALFIDTNILVYAAVEDSPFHDAARHAIQGCVNEGAQLWVSRQVLREYLSAMTRPSPTQGTLSLDTLTQQVRYFESRFRMAEEGPAVTQILLTLLRNIPIAGKQIHDANIVATALAYEIPVILTHNVVDFERFSGIVDILPLQNFRG